MRYGVRFTLDVPFECAFTKAGAVNGLPTYDIPPTTTVRGLVYAAMGRPSLLNQDYYKSRTLEKSTVDDEYEWRQDFEQTTSVCLNVISQGTAKSDLRRRLKHVPQDKSQTKLLSYVTKMETLIKPTYQSVLLCESIEQAEQVATALRHPKRLLYLGHSDNLVDVTDVSVREYTETSEERKVANTTHGSLEFDCVVPNSSGSTVNVLPVEMEDMSGRGKASSGRVKTVSYGDGATTDRYYISGDDHIAVPLD